VITGLNHLTFAVRNLDRSIAFYTDLLGFTLRKRKVSSAYLEAGLLWLALVVDPRTRDGPLPEYSHAAFSIASSDMDLLVTRLKSAKVEQWQEPENPDSFYFLDLDGHKLELHSGDLRSRLARQA